MKTYLVGGAVRDQLLGLSVKERDWLIVGGSEQALLNMGYQRVGRDFPVFLHPKTKEEYALARTERKQGHGYQGFAFETSPQISLEEDLLRRDLTINAMAIDARGKLYDPYQGQRDLEQRILRHVSPAFAEDPVRVLRLARFAARFHSLGFKVAEETQRLVYQMTRSGELSYLVPERVWQEWLLSLETDRPEIFISTLRESSALAVILPELDALFGVPNPANTSIAIDAGYGCLQQLSLVANATADPAARFAVLLSQLGKAKTPIEFWPRHLAMEKRSANLVTALAQRLCIPKEYKQLAFAFARFHNLLAAVRRLHPAAVLLVLEKLDAFRRPALLQQLLAILDTLNASAGCSLYWQQCLSSATAVSSQTFLDQGFTGLELKAAIQTARLQAIKQSRIAVTGLKGIR